MGPGARRHSFTPAGAESFLVRTVLRTILTDENIFRALVVANAPRRYDDAREYSLIRRDVQEPRGKPRVPRTGSGQEPEEQRIAGQVHRRDANPRLEGSPLLFHPLPGRQPPGGHAPAGSRPAGGGARLKETMEQTQLATEHVVRHPGQTTRY